MHENLKTTVSLRKEDNLYGESNNWQLLVPDLGFNTFYCIYGRFRGNTVNNKFYPEECDLHLQNYNGIISIGLSKISNIDLVYDELLKEPVYLLKIYVKALHANEQIIQHRLRMSSFFNISEHQEYHSNGYSQIEKNGVNLNYYLRIDIIFEEMPEELFNINDLSNSKIIDDSIYKRDGDQILRPSYELYEGLQEGEKIFTKLPKNKGDEGHSSLRAYILDGTIYDDRCNPKYVKLLT
ncbi:MAG: hypothetical protein AAF611_18320 [Bacteroidota bacterium]